MSALRTLKSVLASLAVMAPWPLCGVLLLHSQFDRNSEAFFFFGGITLFPLMILALFGDASEAVLITIMMIVWLAVAFLPSFMWRKQLELPGRLVALLAV
ncbi:MAG: hypothetical protein ACKO3W_10500 [bacterium]